MSSTENLLNQLGKYEGLFASTTPTSKTTNITDSREVVASSIGAVQRDREEAAARANSISKQVNDIHLESEVKVVQNWSNSVLFPISTEYKKGIEEFQGAYSVLQATAVKQDYSSGNKVANSTARVNETAQSFRYNSGSNFDIRANAIQTSSEHLVFQSKNHHNQAFLYKGSHVFSWERAEKSIVKQSDSIYSYSTTFFGLTSPNHDLKIGRSKQYYDTLFIQVGQDGDYISANVDSEGAVYGAYDLSVQDSINMQAREGTFTVRSKSLASITSDESLQLQAQNSFLLGSKLNGVISSGLDLSISALGFTSLSGTGLLALSSSGMATLTAPVIFIGSGGDVNQEVDLDEISEVGIDGSDFSGFTFDVASVPIEGFPVDGFSSVLETTKSITDTAFAVASNLNSALSGNIGGFLGDVLGTAGNSLGIDSELFQQISTGVGIGMGVIQGGGLSGVLGAAAKIISSEIPASAADAPAVSSVTGIEPILPYERGDITAKIAAATNGIVDSVVIT